MALLGVVAACGQGAGAGGSVSSRSTASHPASPAPSATPAVTPVALPDPVTCTPPVPAAAPPATLLPAAPLPAGSVVATIPTPDAPQGFAVAAGSVWVLTHRTTEIWRIDPATNQTVAIQYPTTSGDSGAFDISAGPHGLWFAIGHEDVVDRIDTTTNTASPAAQVNGAEWVLDTPAGVWVASTDENAQRVGEIDPASGRVTRSIVIGGGGNLDSNGVSLAYAAGSLWVSRQDHPQALIRIDPGSGQVVAVVALPAPAWGMVGGPSAAYVGLVDHSVARVDPATNCVTAVRSLGPADPRAPVFTPIDLEGGVIQVAYGRGAVAVLDATTLKVVRTYRVDDQDYEGGTVNAFGSTWFATFNRNTVLRLKG